MQRRHEGHLGVLLLRGGVVAARPRGVPGMRVHRYVRVHGGLLVGGAGPVQQLRGKRTGGKNGQNTGNS